MGRVKLGDVVKQIKIKKDPETSGLKYYVAGEHIISDNLKLEKGTIKGSTIGPAFTMYFKPGQVLLMSRRPNLRKMAVADFEGICSNVTYVLESKDQNILTQEYLPFILKSDFFWEFGIKNQSGNCQVRCRPKYKFPHNFFCFFTSAFEGGFSQTTSGSLKLRMPFVQRSGCFALAAS